MKVLFVSSFNAGYISPFVTEQAASLVSAGIQVDFFQIEGKGFWGYLKNIHGLKKKIAEFNPDILHAHYGLSGLLANLQRSVPVVTTFHGSDINHKKVKYLSKLAHLLSQHSIFVNNEMLVKMRGGSQSSVIPCAVDTVIFVPVDAFSKQNIQKNSDSSTLLFTSSFTNQVKNYPLAQMACDRFSEKTGLKVNLLELKGYSRPEVADLINSSECLLLTSFSEGSPQIIKEAMACNCPIVATDVGDIAWLFGDEPGHFITSFEPEDVAEKIRQALEFAQTVGKTNGRERIIQLGLDSQTVAQRIVDVYRSVLS